MAKYSYHRNRMNHEIDKMVKKVRRFEWKHRNLILLAMSMIVAYYILKYKPIVSLIYGLENFGYVTAFISGVLFTYGLTTIPATAVLYNLGQTLSPLIIALIGACGSVVGDYTIFRFVRDRLMDEIKLLSEEIDNLARPVSSLVFTEELRVVIWRKISRSKIWNILIPVIAGLIIASPLPDEIGVALFGAIKFQPKRFILIFYSMNFLGILAITVLARA